MEEEQKQNTQQAKEEHTATSPKHMSIRSILGGDILANDFFKRQTRLLILIMILTVLYIDNRYSSQQELIEIDKLKKDLVDIKYDALTRSSELMEKSRQSRIEEHNDPLFLHHIGDGIDRYCNNLQSRRHHVCRTAILERCSRPFCERKRNRSPNPRKHYLF